LELPRFKRTLRQVLILPIIACLVLAGVLVWQVAGSEKTVVMIERSDQRIALATQIEKLVVDEETGLRGYQVTSDTRFLQPYQGAELPMQQKISDLQAILVRPDQQQILNQFVAEHQLWRQGFAAPLIAIIASGGQARDDDINLTGRARMDAMRTLLDRIIQTSQDSRAERISQSRLQNFHVFVVLFVLALAIGILIGLFTRNRLESVNTAFRLSLDLQHRRAEELFDSEQNLRTTLASIGDGVISCNLAGQVQMMNPVAQELTGWLESQALNRPLAEVFTIINEATRAPAETPVDKVLRLNRVVGAANHTVLVRKDGSEVAIDDSGAPIRNAAGELTGVVMVFRDITMERRTRAALLANEKLAVAGRLAATIAHEIHNPLDSVSNLLYLLQHDPQDSEAGHFLDIAQSELARVTQISRAMLSLYRESKAPVPVDLKEMLDDLLLLMVGRFQSLGVQISADLPPNIAIDGFPAELRQVFTNLITNAAEAAGEGGHVTIVVTPENAGTDTHGLRHEAGATVTVADDGPGITPEVHDRLFQPFFTTKGERGTGLGLWVSQGIVRKHGGILRLESRNAGSAHGAVASVFLASKPTLDPGGD
jgi:PAS domain S-box-containing protein